MFNSKSTNTNNKNEKLNRIIDSRNRQTSSFTNHYSNNGFISDLNVDNNDLIYTVSQKYTERKNSNDLILLENDDTTRFNQNSKIRRNYKSEPFKLDSTTTNSTSTQTGSLLLGTNSIILDTSPISNPNVNTSNSKINRLNKIKTADLQAIVTKKNQQLNIKKYNNKNQLLDTLKSPFFYIPLIIFFLIGLVGLLAGATYLFLFKSISLINSNDKSSNSTNSNSLNLIKTETKIELSENLNKTKDNIIDQNATLPSCGISIHKPNLQLTRIIGGYQVLPKTWPWTVSIAYFGSRTSMPHACGGSLVNRRFVITATHCAIAQNIYNLVGQPIKGSPLYGSLAKMMRVYVGITTRSTDINQLDTYRVEKITSYPNFDGNSFQNDLTILELEKDVIESDSVGYICLTKDSILDAGSDVYAVGWGFTKNNFYSASDSLMQVKFQIQSQQTCGLTYMPVVQFCAGNPTLVKDTCNGDSGGPIMQFINNKWNLVGVVSNGDAMCTGKGIYTNISHYFDWIIQNIVIKSLK